MKHFKNMISRTHFTLFHRGSHRNIQFHLPKRQYSYTSFIILHLSVESTHVFSLQEDENWRFNLFFPITFIILQYQSVMCACRRGRIIVE